MKGIIFDSFGKVHSSLIGSVSLVILILLLGVSLFFPSVSADVRPPVVPSLFCKNKETTGAGFGAGSTCDLAMTQATEGALSDCLANAAILPCQPVDECKLKETISDSVKIILDPLFDQNCSFSDNTYAASASAECHTVCVPKAEPK
jgi:hypothetical protein